MKKIKGFARNERTIEILKVIGKLGFIMFLGVATPNAAGHIIKMLGWVPDYRNRYSTKKALNSLERQELIRYKKTDKERMILITEEGRLYLSKLKIKSMRLPSASKWDGVWRMITFDIPEDAGINRRRFTSALNLLGMFKLEKSVYLYPHECKKQIIEVAKLYFVEKYIRYVVASFVDRDAKAKSFFKLENRK